MGHRKKAKKEKSHRIKKDEKFKVVLKQLVKSRAQADLKSQQ